MLTSTMRAAIPMGLMVMLLVTSCDDRPPIKHGSAVALAGHLLAHNGLEWGPASEVWPPGDADRDGRRWWQIDYRHAAGVDRPAVLVDAESGWARFPHPDERLRLSLAPVRGSDPDLSTAVVTGARASQRPIDPPAQIRTGSWILVLDAQGHGDDLEATVSNLNKRAEASGVRPLFALQPDAAGQSQLVFGWDGTSGIAQDAVILDYLERWQAPPALGWQQLRADH